MIIWDFPKIEEETVRFFQEKGVLAEIATCDKAHEMEFFIKDEI